MTTYRIIGRTNSWIAQRDIRFDGKCRIVIEENLSLGEAHRRLLEMYNNYNDTYAPNWGMAVCQHKGAHSTRNDGTRCFEYDSRFYEIEEEDDNI